MIPIERDRWELQQAGRMARSRLTIWPVAKIKWTFAGNSEFALGDELLISDISLARDITKPRDEIRLIISGFTWECVPAVDETYLKVRLQDV